ncbi:hypothetical protein, partial [Escherichia coli]|uniref:hypothetical protein n=1 Tax=Escherichia coli TaxID=562 RepID=UPI001BC88D84
SSAGGILTFFNESGKILNSFNIYLLTVSLTPVERQLTSFFRPTVIESNKLIPQHNTSKINNFL